MTSGKAERCEFVTSLLAHDISNYNQTSRGYLEMLLEEQMGPLTEEQSRVLTICLRQSSRIQSLIESVRLVSDLEGLPPELEPLPLDEVIQQTIEQVQSAYADREIRVRFTAAGRKVLAESHLPTIFRHLLGNAVRHNDTEVVEIEVEVARTEEVAGAPWAIQIRDNGAGVPPARRAELFDRLEKLNVHGSGLGLSVVKLLVQRCGGKVWVDDAKDGSGAVFGLTLPAA